MTARAEWAAQKTGKFCRLEAGLGIELRAEDGIRRAMDAGIAAT
jgi:L-asparaginase II